MPAQKLWLLEGDARGYDTYDSCVVAAETEEKARRIMPSEYTRFGDGSWASRYAIVTATYLGEAKQRRPGLILASFNAG